MTIGYLPASFDLINVRHVDLVAQAAARCSRLVVGVLSDELVESLSGRPPIVSSIERVALASHLRGVDSVLVHDDQQIAALGEDAVVFAISDELTPAEGPDVVTLTPARDTRSPVLRNALRAVVETEAVA